MKSRAPKHLSKQMQVWFNQVGDAFELDDHHDLLLQNACEAFDLAQTCRKVVERDGPTFISPTGLPKPRPEAELMLKASRQFQLLVRELGLDVDGQPSSEQLRLPRVVGQRNAG